MKLERYLQEWDIRLNERQKEQFLLYYELLVEWNGFMNLTAITDYDDVVLKHFTDSLSAVKVCDFSGTVWFIDVGTGAGFPGIPLKIIFPGVRAVLLDSLNKRVKFLNEIIDRLGLKEITAVHGRAEELAVRREYREQFDFCLSRAVANLSTLAELCLPFVRIGGKFVSYKSEKAVEELTAAKKAVDILGGAVPEQESFMLPESDIYRSLVVIKKISNTPGKYPRRPGLPAKEPLI